jgi:hypothetical protein
MKKFNLLLIAFAFLGLTFSSCQKDSFDGAFSTAVNSNGNFTLTLEINPHPVSDGNTVTLTASMSDVPTSGGNLKIQEKIAGAWVDIAQLGSGSSVIDLQSENGLLEFAFTATSADHGREFRAHFANASSGWGSLSTGEISLVVTTGCEGFHLIPSKTSAILNGSVATFDVSFTLKNCTGADITGIKLQGGLVNGVTIHTSTAGSTVKKHVITWDDISLDNGHTAVYTVNYSRDYKKAPAAGSVFTITGDWSAKAGNVNLADYTTPITWTVADED